MDNPTPSDQRSEFQDRYLEIIGKWNTLGLSEVRDTKPRKAKLKARFKEKVFTDSIDEIFTKIKSSPFLMGDGEWVITFDWLIKNESNYNKILEGNYNERTTISREGQATRGQTPNTTTRVTNSRNTPRNSTTSKYGKTYEV